MKEAAVTSEKAKSKETSGPRKIVLPNTITDRTKAKTYQTGSLLGTGGFARVFLVTEQVSGNLFANKVIDKEVFKEKKNAKEKVEREITIHRTLNHNHVVKFISYFEDKMFVHLLLELCPQKTLLHVARHRKAVAEFEARFYTRQILQGLHYIHSRGILHRDLKLGNMFLSESMVVKIGDFGLATSFEDSKPGSMCGTPNYIAPEVLAKKGHSTASEIWSVGCMVYALFCGSPPFETESVPSTYSRISSGQWSLPPKLSPEAVSFLQTMLAMEPSLRTRVTRLLHHAFMLGPTPASLPPSAISVPPVFQADSSREESPSEFLHSVVIELEHCLDSSSNSSSRGTEAGTVLPNYVAKWLDYSNRLGFGYQLCDGSTGVIFVDGSRIRSDPGQDRVTCTDRLAREGTGEVMLEGERSRRLQLLGFFQRYLASLLPRPALHRESQGGWAEAELVAWRRDEEHVTMQVSNGVLQVHSLALASDYLVWRQQGHLSLSLLTPGSRETHRVAAPCSSHLLALIRDTVLPQARALAGLSSTSI